MLSQAKSTVIHWESTSILLILIPTVDQIIFCPKPTLRFNYIYVHIYIYNVTSQYDQSSLHVLIPLTLTTLEVGIVLIKQGSHHTAVALMPWWPT